MTGKTYILIPPSEAKVPGGSSHHKAGTFDESLGVGRQSVIKALAELMTLGDDVAQRVLNVRGTLFDRAKLATSRLIDGSAPLMATTRRYSGVVWTSLDPATLSLSQRRSILVPSGLYGITAGTDFIGDYRLKMDAQLAPLGSIARYWRPQLTTALVSRVGRSVVVDLLPKEHAAAIDWTVLEAQCDVVRMSFVRFDGGGAAGHSAKAVKGAIARRVLDVGLRDLESFCFDGWRVRRDGDRFVAIEPRTTP